MAVVHLGFSCNNRCVFCAQGDLRQAIGDPTFEELERELSQLAGPDERLALTGGEPTLRSDLPELIARARALDFASVLLQTNGRRLAYRKYVDELVDAGLDRVEISVQGARPNLHDYLTAVPGSGQQTLSGVRNAVAAGLKVTVTTVPTRSSYRHLADLVGHVVDLGVVTVHAAFPMARGAAVAAFDRVIPRLALLRPHLAAAARAARGRPLLTSDVPLCLLDGNEAGATVVHGATSDGVFGDACDACALRELCPGVTRQYADRFGFGELDPRASAPNAAIRDRAHQLGSMAWTAGPGRLDP